MTLMETLNFIIDNALILVGGIPVIIFLTLSSALFGILIGLLSAFMATSNRRILRISSKIYIYIFRSVPFLMFIFLIFYGLPGFGIEIGAYETAILALSLNHGAYFAEIIRGGLLSFDKGQNEAAIALGFSFYYRMKKIVLPQVTMKIMPTLISQIILMVKDTSIVSVIGISEISRLGREIVVRTNEPFIIFAIVALMYFVICLMLQQFSNYTENRLQRLIGKT